MSSTANGCPLRYWETHWNSGIPRDVPLYHILHMVQMGWDSGIPRDVPLYHILRWDGTVGFPGMFLCTTYYIWYRWDGTVGFPGMSLYSTYSKKRSVSVLFRFIVRSIPFRSVPFFFPFFPVFSCSVPFRSIPSRSVRFHPFNSQGALG
jgi:hypothetical protein